jgi:polysaccharide deacetylase 2 family uncharacterized protein YibQ
MSEQRESIQNLNNNLDNRKYFMVLLKLLPIVLIVVLTGVYFAFYTSEPEFESKTEELLYSKSKHPKYVIVIPDDYQRQKDIEKFNVDNNIIEEPDVIKEQKNKSDYIQKVDVPEVKYDDDSGRYSYPRKYQKDIDDYKPTMNNHLLPVSKSIDEIIALTPSVGNLGPKPSYSVLRQSDPLETIQENQNGYILPKISDKGHKPWMIYSKEVDVPQKFHKVIVVFKNMGMNKKYTEAAINSMPENITLSFNPYTKDLTKIITSARKNGHETYLDLLLEPKDYPINDIGDMGITTLDNLSRNLEILDKNMNVNAAYGGFISNRGGNFVDDEGRMIALYQALADRGLLFVDGSGGKAVVVPEKSKLAHKVADLVIDNNLYREAIIEKLRYAEDLAKHYGDVLIIVEPKPITMLLVKEWIASFSVPIEEDRNVEYEKPFMLVPISSIVNE